MFVIASLIIIIAVTLAVKLESPLPEGIKKDNVVNGNILECDAQRAPFTGNKRSSYVTLRIDTVRDSLTGQFRAADDIDDFRKECSQKQYVQVKFKA